VLDDYVVNVRLPIDDAQPFALGAEPGHHTGADTTEPPWYWDGQDIWVPPGNAMLFAALRGTLSFVPSGTPYFEWDSAITERYGTPLPAIGDALLLQVWPADYVKLQELMPPGAQIPKHVLYQNVDREIALQRAEALIVDQPEYVEHYRKVFAIDTDEGAIADSVLRERARRWLRDEWLQHRGMGILVAAGDHIGDAACPPTAPVPGLPADVRVEHGAPSGADAATWRRLTLKVATDAFVYDPAFFYYIVANLDHPEWTSRPPSETGSDRLPSQWTRAIAERRVIKVTHQLNPAWEYGQPPEPEMPLARPELVLRLKQRSETQTTVALFDPFEELWRAQASLQEEAGYEWGFEDAPLYAQLDPGFIYFDPAFPDPEVGVRTNYWFDFDGHHRFILGVNMASCRKRSGHDLAANFFQPTWDVWIEQTGSAAALANDFRNIAAAGFSTVRVWAFEQMEGLDFEFETDYQTAVTTANASPPPTFPLKRVTYRGEPFYACSEAEFGDLTRHWSLRVISGRRIAQLMRNAEAVQRAAQAQGLRVLWTLWTHYGESILGLDGNFWNDFIQVAHAVPDPPSSGRLPLQAWLYRALMVDPAFRGSYIENAVHPLIQILQSVGREYALGYEIMNEANLHWADSGTGHVGAIGGTPAASLIGAPIWIEGARTGRLFRTIPTNWPLSGDQIQEFANVCLTEIWTDALDKIALSGVTNSALMDHQMELFWDPSTIRRRVELSASAITRYVPRNRWRQTPSLPSPTVPYLRYHHDRCLFVEAGEDPSTSVGFDCHRHYDLVREIIGQCFSKGYAGVFLWEYGDPERGMGTRPPPAYRAQNALTEAQPLPAAPHNHPTSVRFTGAAPRPAVDAVREFVASQEQFVLPLLPPRP